MTPESFSEAEDIFFMQGNDVDGNKYCLSAWKPSYEDLQALQKGDPIFIKIFSDDVPKIILFTLDSENKPNI